MDDELLKDLGVGGAGLLGGVLATIPLASADLLPSITDSFGTAGGVLSQRVERDVTQAAPADFGLTGVVSDVFGVDGDDVVTVRTSVVVEAEGDIGEPDEAGFINYWFSKDGGVGVVQSVYVSDEYRSQGLGVGLYETALESMRENGVSAVFADVTSDGGRAVAKRAGFEPVGDGEIDSRLSFNRETQHGVMRRRL